MSAPRCTVCNDTGEVGQLGSLDCTACTAAETRMRLNAHMAFVLHMPVTDRDWAVFQYAQGVAEGVVRDVDAPETVTKESDDAEWLDQFSHVGGAVAFHLIERHGKDWGDCGRLMDLFAKARAVVPIAAKPSEAVPQKLRDIGQRLRTQDDEHTADAMYVVERKRILTGLDTDYSQGPGDIVWCVEDSMIFHGDDEFDTLESAYEATSTVPQDYTRTGFSVTWDLVTVFFTRSDAEAFIERHGHKYGGDLRFTIECEVRNEQWREIREWMMSLAAAPLPEAGSAAPAGEVERIPDGYRLVRLQQRAYETPRGAVYGGKRTEGVAPLYAIVDEVKGA